MKKIAFIFSLLIMASCAKDNSNFTLKASIKNLKKGTVYLQKFQDSMLVSIDSLKINGESQFELKTHLEGPEVLFLKLDKKDKETELIPFFADIGITEISTTLKYFFADAKIKGSKQHEKLEEYKLMMSKFNDKNLDLIKNNLDARKSQDSILMNWSSKELNNLVVKKYLYTVNFALNNKNSEIAPYIVVSEIPDVNVKYLDTINNVLPPEIKTSKYGKELQQLIEDRKDEQKKQ